MTSPNSSLLACASAIAVLLGAGLAPQTGKADDLDDAFKSPPASARPWARWWWPGGAESADGLKAAVDNLKAGGFGGGEIQPFGLNLSPTPEQKARIEDYATPSFFEKVRLAAQAAQETGLGVDYTFGSGWPSGGGDAITPELALVELTMAATTVEGGATGPIKVALPKRTAKLGGFGGFSGRKDPAYADWAARIAARQKVVAVVAVRGEAPELKPKSGGFNLSPFRDVARPGELAQGSAVVLTDKLGADGQLDWTPPPGRWQVLVFKQYVADSGVSGGVGGPQLVLDHFRREAFDAHARRVGDPLSGTLGAAKPALQSVFIDSLELMQDLPWSPDFLEQFKKRRGYDLTPYLPLILQPGWMQSWNSRYSPPYYQMGDLGERVRADYRQTVSDLEIENFFVPFADWARSHGFKSRLQAHGGTSDILKTYGLADVPETEDLENKGDPYFMRLARAAADHGGKRLVSAEAFAFPDEPYDITPSRLRARADLLFSGGVNHIVEHGSPYAEASETWPGWYPFAPTNYNGHGTLIAATNPLYPGFARLNAYITRMQSVLRQGVNVVPVALYYGEIGYYHGIEAKGADGLAPQEVLLEAGYDCDRINDDLLTRSRVVKGALVTPGGMAFQALVFPAGVPLRAQTAQAVARFARQGLKVVFIDAAPARAPGLLDHDRQDAKVRAAMSKAAAAGARASPLPALAQTLRDERVAANLTFVGPSALFVERRAGDRTVYFLHNRQSQPKALDLTLTASGRVEQWDAWTGQRTVLASNPTAGGHRRLTLTLPPEGSALLVVGGADQAATPAPAAPVVLAQITGPWSLSVQGHGAQARVVASQVELDALRDWSQIDGLGDVSGTGRYSARFTLSPADIAPGRTLRLDLGQVADIASITLNGQRFSPEIGPYAFDITQAAVQGVNALEIQVANSPNNAMVGPKTKSLTPKPAGLLGPVRITTQAAP